MYAFFQKVPNADNGDLYISLPSPSLDPPPGFEVSDPGNGIVAYHVTRSPEAHDTSVTIHPVVHTQLVVDRDSNPSSSSSNDQEDASKSTTEANNK